MVAQMQTTYRIQNDLGAYRKRFLDMKKHVYG